MVRIKSRTTETEIDSAAQLARLLDGREISPGQFMALCPAHNDQNPSLAIKQGSQRILLYCHAGCKYQAVIEALEERGTSLDPRMTFKRGKRLPDGISSEWDGKNYVSRWDYRNADGETVGHVVRYESGTGEKEIIPYFKKENGRWKAGFAKEIKDNRPLYNLHKICQASDEEEIWIVEGEKCADALVRIGVVATTSPGGSNAPTKTDWATLASCRIVIWPDKDQAGKVYAANVLRMLLDTGDSDPNIDIVDVDQLDLQDKGDVYDWIEKGHGRTDILYIPRRPARGIFDVGVIEVDQGNIWKAVDQAEELLMRIDPYAVFQRCGMLVRVSKTTHRTMQAREEQSTGLIEVTPNYLLDLFNRKLTFVQLTKDRFKAIDPPAKVANRYLARKGHWRLHPLTGLLYAPTLRPNGSALDKPGYDEKSGIFYDNTGTRFRPLKKDLNKENATRALKRLRTPFQDFPFIGKEDESVALAAVLTALIRQSIGTAPLFGFTAPVAGSGKTLLANIVSIIATGKQAVVAPQGSDKEEDRKHLFAKLLQGNPIVLIDNVERPLSSDVLSMILTAPGGIYSDRILGKSKIVEVPTNITFMATGNNLSFEGDMTRRALLCTIDPKCENPETRSNFKIKGSLESHVHEDRVRYVRAGLTILKAYVEAGKPKLDIPPYGSFEDWSDWVRSALVWLGCEDPNITRKKIEQNDPVKMNLGRILSLWEEIYGTDVAMKTSEIVRDCNKAVENDRHDSPKYELAQAFLEVTRAKGKQLDAATVGRWFRNNKDKIHGGYKIIKSPDSPGNRAEWMLTSA